MKRIGLRIGFVGWLVAALLLGGCGVTLPPTGTQATTAATTTTTAPATSAISTATDATTSATAASDSVILSGVPVIAQMPAYPTGCESVSAVMALQYAGYAITVDEFIDLYLPRNSNFYNANGQAFGPSPYEYFIGNPRTTSAFGCMSPVIKKAINAYLGEKGAVEDASGQTMAQLCTRYIDKGYPVLVWVTINMIEPYYTKCWTLESGQPYRWLANEHCMVLIGYDNNNYYFNDPYRGAQVSYPKALCERRYESFEQQALVIR